MIVATEAPLLLNELKNSKYLWVASVGTLDAFGDGVRWSGFLIPTKMKILSIVEQPANKNTFDFYSYVKINLIGLQEQLDYRVNTHGHIERKYKIIIGLHEMDIFDDWLDQLKTMLKDTWSGINNNNANQILKRFIIENEYEYFNTRYPELLI